MELGEKLLQARKEAGLSQRQLCGEVITRNMLSQIEHGTARPSMATLQYLAGRLGKPVSYFLEESQQTSPNHTLMMHARRAYAEGRWEEARTILEGFQQPDEIFAMEYSVLLGKTTLLAAEQAIAREKILYAKALLMDLEPVTWEQALLERSRILLLASITETGVPELCSKLESLDEELFVRARAALEQKQWSRGLALMDAAENQESEKWHLLRGKLCLGMGDFSAAAAHFQKAETVFPAETAALLEICFRELGDFKQAYEYACKQRKGCV